MRLFPVLPSLTHRVTELKSVPLGASRRFPGPVTCRNVVSTRTTLGESAASAVPLTQRASSYCIIERTLP